jgi:tRNA U34 5-methylaminomethyl-2-thiouridine-forming methyltransferase MnmC
MNHPLYSIVTTTAGAVSILHRPTGEIMHNPVGPWIEANALYVEQSDLRERWKGHEGSSEFTVYDVGLGAAANALATLHCIFDLIENEPNLAEKPFRLISFEKEIELLHYALSHAEKFPHFSGFEDPIRELIEKKSWKKSGVTWELREGDFLEHIESEETRAHLIFFDPYSPKMNPEMWSTSAFRKLFARTQANQDGGASLFTYSQATPIRVALFRAGFFVGAGKSTGLKNETTVAATEPSLLIEPLGDRWLKRWKSSQTPYPFLTPPEEESEIREFILGHPQFALNHVPQKVR